MTQKGKVTKTEIFLLLLTAAFLLFSLARFALDRRAGAGGTYRLTTQKDSFAAEMLPEKININTATMEELQQLEGIGPVLAERIIAYRRTEGDFTSPEDLLAVEGIGPVILETIRPRIIITTEEQP